MIGALARAMFPVYSRLPLIAFVMPYMVSLLQPVLREDAGPQKDVLHESSSYCTMMAARLLAVFPTLAGPLTLQKLPVFYVKFITDFLHCVVLLLSIGVRGVSGKGTRYHIGLAKLEWNIHGL